jgi:hypothetical protein
MKLKPLSKIDLKNKPVQKWLKVFGLRLNHKTGGEYHKKANLEHLLECMLEPALFMQAFNNVEMQDETIMFR